ncbi:MAG: hypothetical protein RH917_04650 [Lacipirellulaceae bacterium]
MDEITAILVLMGTLTAAVVGLLAFLNHQRRSEKRSLMNQLARKLNWKLETKRYRLDQNFYVTNSYFSYRYYAYHTLTGTQEFAGKDRLAMMSEVCEVGNDSGPATDSFICYLMFDLPLPQELNLEIESEGRIPGNVTLLGCPRIKFESDAFNRRCEVRSSDKRFASHLVDPRMMEFLMQNPGPDVLLKAGRCYFIGRNWHPTEFYAVWRWAQEFLKRWPSHVVDELTVKERVPG